WPVTFVTPSCGNSGGTSPMCWERQGAGQVGVEAPGYRRWKPAPTTTTTGSPAFAGQPEDGAEQECGADQRQRAEALVEEKPGEPSSRQRLDQGDEAGDRGDRRAHAEGEQEVGERGRHNPEVEQQAPAHDRVGDLDVLQEEERQQRQRADREPDGE